MEENAALRTIRSSIQALGRGFDVNYDTRLLYCKGVEGARVVEVDEEHTKDVLAFEGLVVPGVSRDVRCLPECQSWQSTGVCTYTETLYHNLSNLHLQLIEELISAHPLSPSLTAHSEMGAHLKQAKIDAMDQSSKSASGIYPHHY